MEQLQKLVSEAYCNSGGMELAKALLENPQDPGRSNNNALPWCICSKCRVMATAEEMCAAIKGHVSQLWDGLIQSY